MRLEPTQTFRITDAEGSPSASFDSVGNATFNGTITSDTLNVLSDATVSGVLYADRITTGFGDLGEKITELETSISSASGTYTTILTASPSAILADLGATIQGETNQFVQLDKISR